MPAKLVEVLLQDPAHFHHRQRMAVDRHVDRPARSPPARRRRERALSTVTTPSVCSASLCQPPRLRDLADDVVVLHPRRPRAGLHHGQDRRLRRQRVDARLDLQERFREEHLGVVAEELLLGVDERLGQADQLVQQVLRRLVGERAAARAAWRWSPRGGSTDWGGSRTSRRVSAVPRARP